MLAVSKTLTYGPLVTDLMFSWVSPSDSWRVLGNTKENKA